MQLDMQVALGVKQCLLTELCISCTQSHCVLTLRLVSWLSCLLNPFCWSGLSWSSSTSGDDDAAVAASWVGGCSGAGAVADELNAYDNAANAQAMEHVQHDASICMGRLMNKLIQVTCSCRMTKNGIPPP